LDSKKKANRLMMTFEERTARAGMSPAEIQKFVGDFTDALVKLALPRLQEVDSTVQEFGSKFDSIAGSLDWANADLLATAGIDITWLVGTPDPQRTFMHPDFITNENRWIFVRDYITASMVSDKASKVLFPNLYPRRRPRGVSNSELLEESKLLNHYLRLAHEAGFTGDRVVAYHGGVKTHSQGQNDSGAIGTVGAAVAIRDALDEISPGAVIDTYGNIPSSGITTPADIVKQMSSTGYTSPKALLLSSQRAIILSADPDIAIVSRIGIDRLYGSAEEAYKHWSQIKRRPAEQRSSILHQAAVGEVKTALDKANQHERIALAARELPSEVLVSRFLLMAMLTPDILDPQRKGRRAMYNRDAPRFQDVFNLYFTWGYDSARDDHPEHWEDFKERIKQWTAL
jgi:hypothetical protein